MNIGEREETWFDTSITYKEENQQQKRKNNDWINRELVTFWEGGSKEEGVQAFDDGIFVAGKQILSMFTKERGTAQKISKSKLNTEMLQEWYKPFKGLKGSWKELNFCDQMTKDVDLSLKEANRAKSFCYKKSV